jgi:hypothetical protein
MIDPENKLKDMCRIIDPSLECVDATENNDKSNLATRVHQLVEEELPLLRFLHQKRSLGILTSTRKQLLKDLYYKKLRLVGDFSGMRSIQHKYTLELGGRPWLNILTE